MAIREYPYSLATLSERAWLDSGTIIFGLRVVGTAALLRPRKLPRQERTCHTQRTSWVQRRHDS